MQSIQKQNVEMLSAVEFAVGHNKGQPQFCAFSGRNLRLERAKNKNNLLLNQVHKVKIGP